jgi:hypothetical protein
MVFSQNHPKHPGEPKGMKQVLTERGLWQNGLLLICKNKKKKKRPQVGWQMRSRSNQLLCHTPSFTAA